MIDDDADDVDGDSVDNNDDSNDDKHAEERGRGAARVEAEVAHRAPRMKPVARCLGCGLPESNQYEVSCLVRGLFCLRVSLTGLLFEDQNAKPPTVHPKMYGKQLYFVQQRERVCAKT